MSLEIHVHVIGSRKTDENDGNGKFDPLKKAHKKFIKEKQVETEKMMVCDNQPF